MKGDPLEWVYFKRLARDAYKPKRRPKLLELLKEGDAAISGAHFTVMDSARNGDKIIAMAQAELVKEQAFLQQVFGVSMQIDFSQKGSIKTLIDTINACLNLKDIYERNKEIIKNIGKGGKVQKGVFSYFHTYVLQAFEKRRTNIKDKVIRRFKNGEDFYNSVREVLDKEFDTYILPQAIELMFNTNPENGLDKNYKNAYKDFLRGLHMLPNNQYMEQLKQTWQINELINKMTESIVGSSNREEISDKFRKYKKGGKNGELRALVSKTYTNNATGLSLEHLDEAIKEMIVAGLTGTIISKGNFTLKISPEKSSVVSGMGQKEGRADGSVIFNANASKINSLLGDSTFEDRVDAVSAFNRIGKYLERLKKGFIVYTNAKNYSLNSGFKGRGGFSAGTAVSLDVLEGALSKVVDNLDELEAIILNAGYNAIGRGVLGDASQEIAKAIAYMLFDDWDYVGQLPKGGGQALHVLNLNGILVPLSTFLYGFGQAINQVSMNPTSFVQAHINLYRYNVSDEKSYGMENWEATPDLGKQGTTISFNFLKDFTSLIAQYL